MLKNNKKSLFELSGLKKMAENHQIILKNPQKNTAMTFETDAHLGAGV